jgi:hypothetical protein
MATPISSRSMPRLALQCGAAGQLAVQAPLGWRERLLQALNLIRWSRASPAVASGPFGYEALGGLDEHLLADIGAPELVRERARQCQNLQRQRVIEFEHGHRSIGDGRW